MLARTTHMRIPNHWVGFLIRLCGRQQQHHQLESDNQSGLTTRSLSDAVLQGGSINLRSLSSGYMASRPDLSATLDRKKIHILFPSPLSSRSRVDSSPAAPITCDDAHYPSAKGPTSQEKKGGGQRVSGSSRRKSCPRRCVPIMILPKKGGRGRAEESTLYFGE